MTGWIGAALAILGVLVGGGLTWLNSRFQLKQMEARDRKKFLLAKLEELYEIINQIGQTYSELTSEQSKIVIDRLQFQVPNSPKLPIGKLNMLVDLYAVELKLTLSRLTKCCDEYGEVLIRRIGLEGRTNEVIKAFIHDLKREDAKVSQACIALTSHIAKLTKNYI